MPVKIVMPVVDVRKKTNITIVNDTGVGHDTKVFRNDTGEDITAALGINRVELEMGVEGIVEAVLYCNMLSVRVSAEAFSLMATNPVTGKVEKIHKIEFESGDYMDWHGLLKVGS